LQATSNITPSESEQEFHRRNFLVALIYTLAMTIFVAFGVPAFLYLFVPPRGRKRAQWVDAGEIPEATSDVPQEMTFRRNRVDGWKIFSESASAWVIKKPDGSITAFSPWCTHLGCAYHWDQSQADFACPCHGSRFSLDGKVLVGPALRPLDRYEVKIEGTRMWLGPIQKSGATRA
jgi:menaquinol-cytochrome c reductase iron-sulfur subunit